MIDSSRERLAHGGFCNILSCWIAAICINSALVRPSKITARARLTEVLGEEILRQSSEDVFGIESEHRLCRRFNVSRVTVRLALSDLEARGLIFRRHGKGTFAYGRLSRIRRSIGILLRTLPAAADWPFLEIIRGFHHGAAALPANVLLIHAPPQEWSPEMIKTLGGVFLFPSGLSKTDLDLLGQMKIPTLAAWETNLPGPFIDFGHTSAARIVADRMLLGGHEQFAFISGPDRDLDALNRKGVVAALAEVGLPSQRLIEYAMRDNESSVGEIVYKLVNHQPGVTAVILTDDIRAIRFMDCFRKNTPIQVSQALSVASLYRPPDCEYRCPDHSTVGIDYFEGGKKGAEALNRAFLTGTDLVPIVIKPKFHQGCTLAANSFANFDLSI